MTPNRSRVAKFWRRLVQGGRSRQDAPRPYYYLGPDIALTRLKDGHHLYVDPRDETVSASLITRGFWESHIARVVHGLVSPGDHIVDVGSNIGYYAVTLAARVGPKGSVTAIEANPHLARLTKMSLRYNGYADRSRVLQKAASDHEGEVRFTTSSRNSGGGHVHFENSTLGDDTRILDVQTVRLDDLGLDDVKLIRIDTEGSEALVLAGAALLTVRPDIVICMEWDTVQMSSRSSPTAFANHLASLGFRFWWINRWSDLIEISTTDLPNLAFADLIVSRQLPIIRE